MTKYNSNPWAKKSKAGMRSFNKAFSGAYKVGKAVSKSAKSQNTLRKIQTTNVQPTNLDTQDNAKGCLIAILVFVIGTIVSIILSDKSFESILFIPFIWFFIAIFINFIVSSLTSDKSSKKEEHKKAEEKIDNESVENTTQIITSQNELNKIDEILKSKEAEEKKKILVKSFENSLDIFLNDNILSFEEENRLSEFQERFKLTQNELNEHNYFETFIQASILRSILNGEVPESKIKITDGSLPFLLTKNEELLWLFKDVQYYEDTLNKQYVGQSSGVSMRIAKGLYYRMGSFKGQPIITSEMKLIDFGILGLTDKNFYFYSSKKSLKIPYSKIISLLPYEDGVSVHKEGVTAKPQVFKNINGWFVYNLITNLMKM